MELQNHCMCSKVRCASIGALDHCTPIPWGGSQVHQEVPLGLQSLVLGLQVVLLVLQDILVVEAPELEKVLLGIPDVQNVLQVLRVLHNGHHMAAEGEPVGGRHIVEALGWRTPGAPNAAGAAPGGGVEEGGASGDETGGPAPAGGPGEGEPRMPPIPVPGPATGGLSSWEVVRVVGAGAGTSLMLWYSGLSFTPSSSPSFFSLSSAGLVGEFGPSGPSSIFSTG